MKRRGTRDQGPGNSQRVPDAKRTCDHKIHFRTFALPHSRTAVVARGSLFPVPCSLAVGRSGFALVSVLWILVGVSALALAANLAGREAVAAARNRADLASASWLAVAGARNRADLANASWLAEACVERARAAVAEALAAARNEPPGATIWGRMDRVVAESPYAAGCAVEMVPAGAALDLNAADGEAVHRLLLAIGAAPATADSLADALLDWRDADDAPRTLGAEAGWYRAAGLAVPRDGPLADVRELRRVRGWERVPGIDTLLSAEPGRVPLSHAPPAVLATLPGFSPEAVARVEQMRLRGERVADLVAFTGGLSPGAQGEAMRRFPELAGAAVVEPEAWIVRARAGVGTPAAVSVVEVRLVRAGERAAIVRRRTWSE